MNRDRYTLTEQREEKLYALNLFELTHQLYLDSRHDSCDLHRPLSQQPPAHLYGACPQEEEQAALFLPPALQQSLPVQEALQARASTRFYASAAIPLPFLATMLYHASEGDRQNWPQDQADDLALQLCLVAWRVEGLAPAVYQYQAQAHAFQKLHRAPAQPDEAESLVLQREFAYAPAIILIIGNLASACARYGTWGHRQLLLRAGAAGQRLWLASLGLGLAGTVFAGFLPQAARTYFHTDGYTRLNLLAYATGYPFVAEQAKNSM